MKKMLFRYDGTTYDLPPDVASDLLARGVIYVDAGEGAYELSLDHLIEEVEPLATVVERSDAPKPPRLGRFRVRDFSPFGGIEQLGFPATTNDLTPTEVAEDPPTD